MTSNDLKALPISRGMARGSTTKSVAVEARIRMIRGHRVLLDADLAKLYGVSTKRLNQAVNRNASRFPVDFMFQLSPDEGAALRSQIATSNLGRGGRRYQPHAFTEHGVAMVATVLRSTQALALQKSVSSGPSDLSTPGSSARQSTRRPGRGGIRGRSAIQAACPRCWSGKRGKRPRSGFWNITGSDIRCNWFCYNQER